MPHPYVKFLVSAGLQAPSADNLQPWHFTWDGNCLALNYDTDRVAGQTFQSGDPATLLSAGGVIENLVQATRHLGLQIQAEKIRETDLKTGTYFRMRPDPKGFTLSSDRFGDLPLFHRHTNRLAFKNEALDRDLLDLITADGELSAKALLITDPEKIRGIASLVRSASEVRFQTREVHEWLGKSLRFGARKVEFGDGLDVATLDLPPGGGLFLKIISDWERMAFLNRFRVFKVLSMIDSAPIGKARVLVAISSPAGKEQVVAAGRLLTRIWTTLNIEGVAVHPYYVIPDQLQRLNQGKIPGHLVSQARMLEHSASRIFGLEKNSTELRMLLRVGYPRKKPVRSVRLPLEAVFTDISKK